MTGDPDILVLSPNQTATQDCAVPGYVPLNEAIRIDIDEDYKWFFGFLSGVATKHFNMRRFGLRLILVPDVEPRLGPPPPVPAQHPS